MLTLTLRSPYLWLLVTMVALCSCENIDTNGFTSAAQVTYASPSLQKGEDIFIQTNDETTDKKIEKSPEKTTDNTPGKSGELWMPDEGQRGLVGNVYDLSDLNSTERSSANFTIIDLHSRTPAAETVVIPNLDVKDQNWSDGFPGRADLIEWFAIRFEGKLHIETAAEYHFGVNSDDGALVYIDDVLVVNNDGNHPQRFRDGIVTLTAGYHDLRVDYYQGPKVRIALQLYYRAPGEAQYKSVPPEVLYRP